MEKIYVYDFDKTIYCGDASLDFWKYSFKKKPFIIKRFPAQVCSLFLNKLGLMKTKRFKEIFFSFLKDFSEEEIKGNVLDFWKSHEARFSKWFLSREKEGKEVVISASPEFLLQGICKKNNIEIVIGTIMDQKGRIQGLNCKGEEKICRLNKLLKNYKIEKFYSDSDSDLPLARISTAAYKVKKHEYSEWII